MTKRFKIDSKTTMKLFLLLLLIISATANGISQERKELESFLGTIKTQENRLFIAQLTRYKIGELNGHMVSKS